MGLPSYDHQRHPSRAGADHAPTRAGPGPDEMETEEKLNISQKLETIDYSHGVQAAMSASRGWGSDQPTIQSVDYNHGQGVMPGGGDYRAGGGGGGGGGYPPSDLHAPYGGAFQAYPGYEGGFPPGGGGGGGGVLPQGLFPGMDAAAIFAAYNEQTG